MTTKLTELGSRTNAKIILTGESPISERLHELGFTPGADVHFLFAAPSGNPRAYGIRGTVIALRNKDADYISVSEVSYEE